MDASSNGHTPQRESAPRQTSQRDRIPSEDVAPEGWRVTLPRALGFSAFLAMALFWIWAFVNQDSIEHADVFNDPTFVAAAEEVCKARQDNIASLPLASAVDNPQERSDLINEASEQLRIMTDELAALTPPTDPKGADGVRQWLIDYDIYLADRQRYADLLATGEDPAFTISASAGPDGGRVTDILTTFADVNGMRSCAPTGDV